MYKTLEIMGETDKLPFPQLVSLPGFLAETEGPCSHLKLPETSLERCRWLDTVRSVPHWKLALAACILPNSKRNADGRNAAGRTCRTVLGAASMLGISPCGKNYQWNPYTGWERVPEQKLQLLIDLIVKGVIGDLCCFWGIVGVS